MDRSLRRGEDDEESVGFAYTRRQVLETAGSLGVAASLAGCNESDSSTDSPTPTFEPTETVAEPIDDIVDDDLSIIDHELVAGEGGYNTYLRVAVENVSSDPLTTVGITGEFFDADVEFLEVQTAIITSLRPGEVFEGYVSYWSDDVAAYVIRAGHSSRDGGQQQLQDVSVTDHCLDGDRVRGTIRNDNPGVVSRLSVDVTFYDEDGRALGTDTDTVVDVPANSQVPFAVESDTVYEHGTTAIDDYDVSVGDYGGGVLAVR